VRITCRQALAWRMQRHLLNPVGDLSVTGVVRRLGGVQAQVASSAELAVRVRREASRPGEVARGLSEGRLIKTWAMRGALHLLTPEDAGAFLSLLGPDRLWESWRRYLGMTAKRMDVLRSAICDALEGEPLTRVELAEKVITRRGLRSVGAALGSSYGELLKPLAWRGDLCFGPSRGGRVTFTRPENASSRWAGVPDPDDAAPIVIAAYFGTYGPATVDALGAWLGARLDKRRLRTWFSAVGDRLAEVEVDGEHTYVLAEDLDELASARPTRAVRLLPGFDQYVLGPGTADGRVVPTARRSAVSRQAGWISPVVVAGGVVSGTWELDGDQVRIAWFREAGPPPRTALEREVARLSSILDRGLRSAISFA
jgi:DNA glycosylase AlkZ-like